MPKEKDHPQGEDREQLDRLMQEAAGGQTIFESVDDLKHPDKIDRAVRRMVAKLKQKADELWQKFLDLRSPDVNAVYDLAKDANVNPKNLFLEWLVQRMVFFEMGKHFKLESVDNFSSNRPDCAIVLTRSSSIFIAGQLIDMGGRRDIDYVRIDSRKAGWSESHAETEMNPLYVGAPARFRDWLTSSPVQGILVLPAERFEELEAIKRGTANSVFTARRVARPSGKR